MPAPCRRSVLPPTCTCSGTLTPWTVRAWADTTSETTMTKVARRRRIIFITNLLFGKSSRDLRSAVSGIVKEHADDALAADRADDLAHRAIHEEQDDEPDLDGPEMRPHDFVDDVA